MNGDLRKNITRLICEYTVSRPQQLKIVAKLTQFSTKIETILEMFNDPVWFETENTVLHEFAMDEFPKLKEYCKTHQKEIEEVLPALKEPMNEFFQEFEGDKDHIDVWDDHREFVEDQNKDFLTALKSAIMF